MTSTVHVLPGRIRLVIPGLYRNKAMAGNLEKYFLVFNGVEKVQANVKTGKILIYFNEKLISFPTIIQHLKEIFLLPPAQREVASTSTIALLPSAEKNLIPWYSITGEECAYALGSNSITGLNNEKAAALLESSGPNLLTQKKEISFWQLLFDQFKGFMVKLMLGAAGISFLLGEVVDGGTILAIVLVEGVIGVIQEYKAEKSLSALKDLTAPTACVCRNGQEISIPAKELVPGDIIILETGDHVPADARLLESVNLETVESALTGEASAVSKESLPVSQGYLGLGDQKNMVFMGTNVTQGRGRAVVVATGMETQIGQIAQMLNEIGDKDTPLQESLDKLAKNLTIGCLAVCSTIALIGVLRGRPLVEMARMGVALAVGAMPEGLSAIVTLAMAYGVQRMVRRNAIVRKLPAVENIGYTTVICSDKTGTLTKNEMTVKEIYTSNSHWEVSGEGYLPDGKFKCKGKEVKPLQEEPLSKILSFSALCNNSKLLITEDNRWEVRGDPTEGALLVAAAKAGLTDQAISQSYSRFKEIPFDSNRRRMSVICQDKQNNYFLCTKGAPDTILELCANVHDKGGIKPLTSKEKKKILSYNEKMSKKALRVLALAYRPLSQEIDQEGIHLEKDLVFVGLVGMSDPPRQEAKKALERCRQAGIKVVMITGDQENTATAIANELSLLDGGLVVTGEQLAAMSDEALTSIVDNIQVCTRTSPEQKLRIVRAFRKKRYIVAMTGDGVNDAPAIKESDIGIAMGKVGTDVTREASSITLTDDNFATIVMAVEEGRTIGQNIKKAISYILSGNLGEVISIFSAAAMGLPAPLVPCQILWINLVSEGIMSFTLVTDPTNPTVMDSPPSSPESNILGGALGKRIISRGISVGLANFGVFLGTLYLTGGNIPKARSIAFANLITSQLIHSLDYRIQKGKVKMESLTTNKYLLPSLMISTALLFGVIYPPATQAIFQTVPLNLLDWGIVLGGALAVNFLDKIFAFFLRVYKKFTFASLPINNRQLCYE